MLMTTLRFEPGSPTTQPGGGTIIQNAPDNIESEFHKLLPEDIRAEPSLKDFKDVAGLAKSYVETKRMVGTDKIAKPQENWTDKEWNSFWDTVGRPADPTKYELKLPQAPEGVEVDQESVKAAVEMFHEAGLTKSQAQKLAEKWMTRQFGIAQTRAQTEANSIKAVEDELKKDWGEQFPTRAAAAKKAMLHFAEKSPKVREAVEKLMADPKFGDNPNMLRLWAIVGDELMESGDIRGGGGSALGFTPEQASNQLAEKMKDPEWVKKMQIPGSAEYNQWMSLNKAIAGVK